MSSYFTCFVLCVLVPCPSVCVYVSMLSMHHTHSLSLQLMCRLQPSSALPFMFLFPSFLPFVCPFSSLSSNMLSWCLSLFSNVMLYMLTFLPRTLFSSILPLPCVLSWPLCRWVDSCLWHFACSMTGIWRSHALILVILNMHGACFAVMRVPAFGYFVARSKFSLSIFFSKTFFMYVFRCYSMLCGWRANISFL